MAEEDQRVPDIDAVVASANGAARPVCSHGNVGPGYQNPDHPERNLIYQIAIHYNGRVRDSQDPSYLEWRCPICAVDNLCQHTAGLTPDQFKTQSFLACDFFAFAFEAISNQLQDARSLYRSVLDLIAEAVNEGSGPFDFPIEGNNFGNVYTVSRDRDGLLIEHRDEFLRITLAQENGVAIVRLVDFYKRDVPFAEIDLVEGDD